MMYAKLKTGSWKLEDLVRDPTGEEFRRFLDLIEAGTRELEARRKDLRPDIPAAEFESLIHAIEDVAEKLGIAQGYAHLKYAADTSSNEAAALVTRMDKLASEIGNKLLFFDLWFKKGIDEANAQRLINSVSSVYREYLRHKRLLAKHTLSEPEEKIINTLDVTGIRALIKIYDKITSSFEFMLTLKKDRKVIRRTFKNKEKLLTLVRSPRPEEREAAYRALWQVYRKNSGVLGELYRNITVKWRDEFVSMRGYKSPISVRNIANDLDDATVESLLTVCRRNAPVFQDYFRAKARFIGMKKLRRYDLYAPISRAGGQKRFAYGKAVETVLKTFEEFDPRFREFAERVFGEQHVDSAIRPSKRGGAFCYTVAPRITPYVLLNFDGRTRDVSTMAHEFGHAIHSMAAADKPVMVSQAPLPLAETASVFAEMLLNERLAEKMSKREQLLLLGEEIDDTYATIMRQAFFTLFEVEAHRAIAEENATIDRVSELYLQNLTGQFGDSVTISKDFQWEWLYIPHFYHTPFYCYAYSFGNLLVLSLYQQYKLEGRSSFVPNYFRILAAGGSQKSEQLLKEAGMDISREEFWQKGFDLVSEKVRQLKELYK